jgi:Fe2+ or Zn2+ uptake regulation protein
MDMNEQENEILRALKMDSEPTNEKLRDLKMDMSEPANEILRVLKTINEGTAPAIYRASKGNLKSLASVYMMLKRLEAHEVVQKREHFTMVAGTNIRSVIYKIKD